MSGKYRIELEPGTRIPYMVMEKKYPDTITSCSEKVLELMEKQEHLSHLAEEHVFLLSLSSGLDVRAVFEVSHGTVNSTMADMKAIMIRALLSGAVGIILVHNHPGGSISPSDQDLQFTDKVKKAASLLDIDLLDHLIVGSGGRYYSFRENDSQWNG